MIILRLKSGGMRLFSYLFICIVNFGMLCFYMLNGALYITGSEVCMVCDCLISKNL